MPAHSHANRWIACLLALIFLAGCGGIEEVVDIRRVIAADGAFYVLGARYRPEVGRWENGFMPSDDLETWEAPALPVTRCRSADADICYRIDGDWRVARSDDRGNSWETDWRLPPGRVYFMARHRNLLAWPGADYGGTHDLAILERDDGYMVAVALGREGVLIRDVDGRWAQTDGGDRRVAPLTATNIIDAYIPVALETHLWLLLATIFGAVLFSRVWGAPAQLIWAFIGTLLGGFALFSLLWEILWTGAVAVMLLLLPLIFMGMTYLVWRWQARRSGGVPSRALARIWLGMVVGLVPAGLLPLYLWAFGVIPFYLLALALSVVLVWWVAAHGSRRLSGAEDTKREQE